MNTRVIFVATLLACVFGTTSALADESLIPATDSVPREYFGMHFHRAASSTSIPREGVGSWRLWDARVSWRYLAEKGRTINFSALDKLVGLARERKLDLVYPFGATPMWASARPDEAGSYGPGSAAEPRDIADWNDFVGRVARRYKGQILNYEIWNEPNGGFFTGTLQKLVELGCSAAPILKSVDPNITIVSPSGVGRDPVLLSWLDKFLSLDGGRCVDVIAWHFYVPNGTPESMLATVRSVQEIMRRHGVADKPLWNTETGWRLDLGPTDARPIDPQWKKLDAETSPAYVARALLIGWAAGLKRFYYYSWDHMDMGFLDVSGRTTASAEAYLRMAHWMTGAIVRNCKSEGAVWSCALERGHTVHIVAWVEDGRAQSWSVPIRMRSIENLNGAQRTIGPDGRVELSGTPVLLSP